MVGGRGNESLPFCVDWHHFGAISGTCVPVHQNYGHTTPCFQMETFFIAPIGFCCAPSPIDFETKETNANS